MFLSFLPWPSWPHFAPDYAVLVSFLCPARMRQCECILSCCEALWIPAFLHSSFRCCVIWSCYQFLLSCLFAIKQRLGHGELAHALVPNSNNIETTSDTHAWGHALITNTGLMKAFAKLTRPCLAFKSPGVRRPRLWSLLHDAVALRSHALCAATYLTSWLLSFFAPVMQS